MRKSGQVHQSTVSSGHHAVTHSRAIPYLWGDSCRLGVDIVIAVFPKPIYQEIFKKRHTFCGGQMAITVECLEKQFFIHMKILKQAEKNFF